MSDEHEGGASVDELDETIVVRRPAHSEGRPDDDADETIVVRRPAHSERQPDDDADETVVVRRAAQAASPEDLDRTRVVRRDGEDDAIDRTRVVRRDGEGDAVDRTRVVRRDGEDEPVDRTRVVRRDDDRPALERPRTGRWRRAQPRPVTLPSGLPLSERAAEAPGVDAVEHYRPRPVPAPPPAGPELGSGPEATRAPAPAMRSVRRASRRAAWVALAGIAAACAVSVGGLVAIALTVFAG